MPSREWIVESLTHAAQHYAWVALLWHAALLGGLLFVLLGILPLSARRLSAAAALPAASVMVVAALEKSPFNAVMFGLLWLLSTVAALRLPEGQRTSRGPAWAVLLGALSLGYAAWYQHFAPETSNWAFLLGRSPIGVVPCPTLAAILGLGLLAGGFGSRGWSLTVALWGLFYAVFGVLWLHVVLDVGLLIAAVALLVLALRLRSGRHADDEAALNEERARIEAFLALKRIALVGTSTDPHHFSRVMLKELTRRGLDVVPIHPAASEIEGRRAFARIADVQPRVEGALIMTPRTASLAVVQDCLSAGVTKLWLHRGAGPGAVSEEAVLAAQRGGAELVAGRCPLMFLGHPPGAVHRVHALAVKLGGHYPAST